MDYINTRVEKLREYLFEVINELVADNNYQINIDMLSDNINNYSLDKIPTASTVERWVTGTEIYRDVFSFRSRVAYSQDVIVNLSNIGFFEAFEKKIKSNNEKGVLPNIDNIEEIKCLNCGTLISADTSKAIFNIQIQITYRENDSNELISL